MMASLRQAAAADYAHVASWIGDATTCRRWAGPGLHYPFAAEDLPQLLIKPGARSYCLGPEDSAPYGFGQHWPRGEQSVHLGRIIIAPTLRSRGLGIRLVRLLCERALAESGASEVTLMVYRDNPTAFGLYQRLGFVGDEGLSRADALYMRLAASHLPKIP
jgi:ribosomal protein S18 acetylase RimI-like enzyme